MYILLTSMYITWERLAEIRPAPSDTVSVTLSRVCSLRELTAADFLEEGFLGVWPSTSAERAFLVQVDYFRVTDSPLGCQW